MRRAIAMAGVLAAGLMASGGQAQSMSPPAAESPRCSTFAAFDPLRGQPIPLLVVGVPNAALSFELFVDPLAPDVDRTIQRARTFLAVLQRPARLAVHGVMPLGDDEMAPTDPTLRARAWTQLAKRLDPQHASWAQACPANMVRNLSATTEHWLRVWHHDRLDAPLLPAIAVTMPGRASELEPADDFEPLLRTLDRLALRAAANQLGTGADPLGQPQTGLARAAWRRGAFEIGSRQAAHVLLLPWRQLDDPQARQWLSDAWALQTMHLRWLRIVVYPAASDPDTWQQLDRALRALATLPPAQLHRVLLTGSLPVPPLAAQPPTIANPTTRTPYPLTPLFDARPVRTDEHGLGEILEGLLQSLP